MGRHAADRTAPGSPDPAGRDKAARARRSRHADRVAPLSGSAAMQTFNRLIEPHYEALRAYVLRLTDRDEAAADSVLKETLYRAAAHEPTLLPERPSTVRQWLVQTARNVIGDGERHGPAGHDDRPFWPNSRTTAPPPRTTKPGSSSSSTTVVAAIEELSPAHRRLLVDLFYGGVPLEEAAADRGVPVERIKYQLYLAMRALHTVLDKQSAHRRSTS
jgi:RNA polymerase sigma-70 factor (ECF subfamily)